MHSNALLLTLRMKLRECKDKERAAECSSSSFKCIYTHVEHNCLNLQLPTTSGKWMNPLVSHKCLQDHNYMAAQFLKYPIVVVLFPTASTEILIFFDP